MSDILTAQDQHFIGLLKLHGKGAGAFVVLSKNRRATLTASREVEVTEYYRGSVF